MNLRKLSNEQTDKVLDRFKAIRFMQLFQILNPNDRQEIDRVSVGGLVFRGLGENTGTVVGGVKEYSAWFEFRTVLQCYGIVY